MASFYCQLDYEDVPYLSPKGTEDGNLANNGCGVCSASMVAENLLGVPFPPQTCARLAKACGAREDFGTDMYILAPTFAGHVGLTVRQTENAEEALRFIQEEQGMVIANIRGDRPEDGYTGVFSDTGHYVVLAQAEGTTVKVWDPMYRLGSGRYDKPGRAGKVRTSGTDTYADMSVLAEDCKHRPFFLFARRKGRLPVPKIGISCGEDQELLSRVITKAGAQPVTLHDGKEEPEEAFLSAPDAFVVTGESTADLHAAASARRCGKPVLGFGGGANALLTAAKGTRLPCVLYRLDGAAALRGTRMEAILGQERFACETILSAAVSGLPIGLRPGITAPDGAPLGFEVSKGPFFMGVFWRFSQDTPSVALLQALIIMTQNGGVFTLAE